MNDPVTGFPAVGIEGETTFTIRVVERPPDQRPTSGTIDGMAEWLIGDARRIDAINRAAAQRARAQPTPRSE